MTLSPEVLSGLREREDAGPFVLDLFGGSPKMAISASATSTGGTTVRANRSEPVTLLSGPETKSSSEPSKAMRRSRGDTRNTGETDKRASNATSSETKVRTYRRSLSDRLTLSLISAGLVRGITPSSTRKQSGQPIQVLALDTPTGGGAAKLQRGSSSSNAPDTALQENMK